MLPTFFSDFTNVLVYLLFSLQLLKMLGAIGIVLETYFRFGFRNASPVGDSLKAKDSFQKPKSEIHKDSYSTKSLKAAAQQLNSTRRWKSNT